MYNNLIEETLNIEIRKYLHYCKILKLNKNDARVFIKYCEGLKEQEKLFGD